MDLPRLLLIADAHRERPSALEAAVAAGAPFVQIRDKELDDEAVAGRLDRIRAAAMTSMGTAAAVGAQGSSIARGSGFSREDAALPLRSACSFAAEGAPTGGQGRCPSMEQPWICINGRPAMARREGIGLHLPAAHDEVARDGIALLGRSAHDEAEVQRAVAEGVDYLIVGTVFPSASKPGRPPLGLEGLTRLAALASPLPVFAIGGITPARVASVIKAGAHGVAVCSAVLDVADPVAATQNFLSELNP